mmetsp:Transcript_10628/g.23362  ORF Transcript_10628/g.23362 Transcript_10628/m.23362 type:complete len:161 (-) Transcript_10628:185-667(-)
MLTSLALRTASRFAPRVVASTTSTASRNVGAATAARRTASIRFMGSEPFAVDAPDGDHDLQDLEESSEWTKRTIDVASVLEDADAITEKHNAVLDSSSFAVDAPDGEHDLEDVEEHLAGVERIINSASVLEDSEEVKEKHLRQEEIRKQTVERSFENSKY